MKTFLDTVTGKKVLLEGLQIWEMYEKRRSEYESLPLREKSMASVTQNLARLYAAALNGSTDCIYNMNRDFSEELRKLDVSGNGSNLPKLTHSIYINFPAHMFVAEVHTEGQYCAGVLVSNGANGTCLGITLIDSDGEVSPGQGMFKTDDLKDFINAAVNPGYPRIKEIFKFTINCLLYLNSGDPDLREFRPKKIKLEPSMGRKWRRAMINSSFTTITNVGFGFKKEPIRDAEEWRVKGHFKWQVHGPQLSLLKLIWIDPYVKGWKHESQ